jgi:hypothetical protein
MIRACLSKEPEARPRSGADILALLANQERALVPQPARSLAGMRLEAAEEEEPAIQRIHPRPVPQNIVARPEPKTVQIVKPRRELNLQPIVSAFSVVVQGWPGSSERSCGHSSTWPWSSLPSGDFWS